MPMSSPFSFSSAVILGLNSTLFASSSAEITRCRTSSWEKYDIFGFMFEQPSPRINLQLPQLPDLVPQGGRFFELQALGGGFHFFFQAADALGEWEIDVAGQFGEAGGAGGVEVEVAHGDQRVVDVLQDGRRFDAVLLVVEALPDAAALGFVERLFHRVGEAVGVEDDPAVDVAGGA